MSLKVIDAKTLKIWLDNNEAVLVDVREPAEHVAENIEGAVLLPLGSIGKSKLPSCAGKKLVVHCRKGARGGSACEKLLTEDPNLDIYNLEGGIEAWRSSGLRVISSGRVGMSLDRQVQLAIGLLLIAASILGYILSPLWFLLTGLVGCGLAVAGVTGFCGLAVLVAKMPWNRGGAGTSCMMR